MPLEIREASPTTINSSAHSSSKTTQSASGTARPAVSTSEKYLLLLQDLSDALLRANPTDHYQFCADFFAMKLTQQRNDLMTYASSPQQQREMLGHREPMVDDDDNSGENKQDEDMNEDEDDNDKMDEDDEEEEEEEDDEVAAQPVTVVNPNRTRRTSVSAESMAPSHDQSYEKIVIAKSDEQKRRIEASIKSNFLFKNLDEEQYVDVVNAMAEKRMTKGENVIKQGGIGDFFYVLEEGTCDVYVSRNGGPSTKVWDYGPGGSFGELALMYNAPRAATVTTISDCVLWALDRVTFRRILMENTSRKRRMYENFLEEVSLLSSLEPYERHKIADALESQTFNDGDVIIKQGDVGDNFYIIESGEARVKQTDENGVDHEVLKLNKGDYFGELALLTDKPRKATVVAKGRLKVATLGKKAFVRLLGPCVDILKRNVSNYQNYTQ